MKTKAPTPRFAALDLHARHCVLGAMTEDGRWLGSTQFPTGARELIAQLEALRAKHLELTIEAGPMTRWAAGVVRPHVERLVVCEPRENRLISTSSCKRDGFDVRQLCRLLRLGELHEVWTGADPQREGFRAAVSDLLKLRDQQRTWKTLLKARFRQWGVTQVDGRRVYHPEGRQAYLDQLPPQAPRVLFEQLYLLHDTCLAAWKKAAHEVVRLGRAYPEIRRLRQVPGIGIIGAHVFSAIIETPERFATPQALWHYSQLGIIDRTSDGKPLGYERLDRRGHGELKNLSYHAWRTSCRSTTGDNGVKRYYEASLARTGTIRHARLNTQRKLLAVLWTLWRKNLDYDDALFSPITSNCDPPSGPAPAAEERGPAAALPPRPRAQPGRLGKFRRGTRPAYALGAASPDQGGRTPGSAEWRPAAASRLPHDDTGRPRQGGQSPEPALEGQTSPSRQPIPARAPARRKKTE